MPTFAPGQELTAADLTAALAEATANAAVQPGDISAAGSLTLNPSGAANKSLRFGTRSYLTEIAGDLWFTSNAFYDGTNWQRVDVSQTAFAINFQSKNNIPYESNTKGLIFWRAQAAANPINATVGAVGGWELLYLLTEYKDMVVGGYGAEFDGNGTLPYARFVNFSVANAPPKWRGILTNLFLGMDNVDSPTEPSWFAGFLDDAFVVQRAPAGATTSAGLSTLLTITNAGVLTPVAPVKLPAYAVASLPSASTYSGCCIRVSGSASNKNIAFSDGAAWRWADGTVVS